MGEVPPYPPFFLTNFKNNFRSKKRMISLTGFWWDLKTSKFNIEYYVFNRYVVYILHSWKDLKSFSYTSVHRKSANTTPQTRVIGGGRLMGHIHIWWFESLDRRRVLCIYFSIGIIHVFLEFSNHYNLRLLITGVKKIKHLGISYK